MDVRVGCILVDEKRKRVFLIPLDNSRYSFPVFDQIPLKTLEETIREHLLELFGLEVQPEKLVYTISKSKNNGAQELQYFYLTKLEKIVDTEKSKKGIWVSFDEISQFNVYPPILKQFLLEDLTTQNFQLRFGRI